MVEATLKKPLRVFISIKYLRATKLRKLPRVETLIVLALQIERIVAVCSEDAKVQYIDF